MRRIQQLACACAVAGALAACHRPAPLPAASPTHAPGHVAAGGGTSGEVIGAQSRGTVDTPAPAGTPGIPKGSEGNTGGTALGGAPAEAGSGTGTAAPPLPVRSEKSGTAPPSEDVKTGVQQAPRSVQPSAPDRAGP